MYAKTISYTDFNDVKRTETYYFNLTKAELLEFEMSRKGGMTAVINRISESRSEPELIGLFKEVIARSYGVKSDDGRKFMKSPEILRDFQETEAYSDFFTQLATDAAFAAEFITSIIPKDAREQLVKEHPNIIAEAKAAVMN